VAHSPVPTTVGHEDPAMPRPGEAFFYLVEYSDEWGRSGYGSADVGKPRVVASGDCP
jgi:hypothetical protein